MQAALQTSFDRAATELSLIPGILEIGQAEGNNIQILGHGVSEYHARIVTYFQESFLIDLSSESGTFLNGRRIIKHSIKAGDIIQLGEHCFVVKAPCDWFASAQAAPKTGSANR